MQVFPENEKVTLIKEKSQACYEFMQWLEKNAFTICEYRGSFGGEYFPTHKSREKMLAEYFNIDLNVLEAEKLVMLEAIRQANKSK